MDIIETNVKDVLIIKPTIFKDDRGYFFESFNLEQFNKKTNANFNPVQDNESCSSKGVIRGLHFQKPPYAQAKLVRVVKGSVYDIAVDLRKDSPTYKQWTGCLLTENNHKQFFLPKGMAHGFIALEDNTIFQYKCDNYYNKESEGAVRYDDDDINIDWDELLRIAEIEKDKLIFSEKDLKNKKLIEIDNPF